MQILNSYIPGVVMLGRITLNLYDFMIPSLITTITMQVHVEGDKLLPP